MPSSGTLKPADLNGKRVGIRSFTTTTGAWLRGILANDYGVDLNSIDWVTFEDAHVAEFKDTTKRAPAGKQIIQMLLDGELDAVLGEKVEHPGPEAAVSGCRRRREIMVCQARRGADQPYGGGQRRRCRGTHPDAVREVFRMLRESAALAPAGSPHGSAPTKCSRSLEMISEYAAQQGLIPRAFAVDELFDDLTRTLR